MYMKFSMFTEGSSPSHFPFAEFFSDFPAFFQKYFSAPQKAKKRPSHLSVRRNERKK
jgi:DNA-binding helix-hairpin-helix protein with protein kinase domain